MLESELAARHLRRDVRKLLHGMVVQLIPTVAGIPDRLVLLPGGRLFLIELKTETGSLSEIQKEWHKKAALTGTKVFVLYGVKDVDAWIEAQK